MFKLFEIGTGNVFRYCVKRLANRELKVQVMICVLLLILCNLGEVRGRSSDTLHLHAINSDQGEKKIMMESDIRPALLNMVRAHEKLFADLDIEGEIKESPIKKSKDSHIIGLGNFLCDLEGMKFAYVTGQGKGYASISGRFVLKKNTEWTGEVTRILRK